MGKGHCQCSGIHTQSRYCSQRSQVGKHIGKWRIRCKWSLLTTVYSPREDYRRSWYTYLILVPRVAFQPPPPPPPPQLCIPLVCLCAGALYVLFQCALLRLFLGFVCFLLFWGFFSKVIPVVFSLFYHRVYPAQFHSALNDLCVNGTMLCRLTSQAQILRVHTTMASCSFDL